MFKSLASRSPESDGGFLDAGGGIDCENSALLIKEQHYHGELVHPRWCYLLLWGRFSDYRGESHLQQ